VLEGLTPGLKTPCHGALVAPREQLGLRFGPWDHAAADGVKMGGGVGRDDKMLIREEPQWFLS